ncbi:major facilitator superfamily domain-containing protein [Roridomyces roridus]|uniref:Major facilitator superfamily domain-containing protein n=1 Tax=Roridomyces roridus TaxID=1738132 RepID=A0AAD7FRF1_9AGAR|nr:major facilitator superfamily domain-containing protein [Roridomyces roridus]
MIPPVADQEDPTTQVAWPTRPKPLATENNNNEQHEGSDSETNVHEVARKIASSGKRRMSTWDLVTLSISMAGAQIAWTVELGYGTPFLLGLGISEQLTSLVWLAGPISGLVAQPVIGAISDSSTSKYRRRYWIILSTVALVISTLLLAYCTAIADFVVDLFDVGAGDWDEKRKHWAKNTAIWLAVFCFYILDFALNALQASLRNLLLDVTPASQLNSGNAWHGRMTNAGNIIGFGFGFLPLAELPIINLLGGTQFRKFCVICIVILVATVAVTCYCHEEQERPALRRANSTRNKTREMFDNIKHAVVNLPRPIRRVCYVQLAAFCGWFPFLFYATTYVGQVMAQQLGEEPNADLATRKGEFAMLLYSIVGVVSGTILPHLANRDRRLMAHQGDEDDEDAELTRIRTTVRQWKVEAARKGKPLRLPVMPFLLRNIWTGALALFTILTMSTFFVSTVPQATVFIALIGICWSVAMWAPFAIIMELLKDLSNPAAGSEAARPSHVRTLSVPVASARRGSDETRPLLRRRSYDAFDATTEEVPPTALVAGGTILGVHNLAIVAPQLIVAIVTSLIFRAVDGESSGDENTYLGKNGVAWVLRFGGVCTLFGALLARRVPPTPTERAMRRRLGEMLVLKEESNP